MVITPTMSRARGRPRSAKDDAGAGPMALETGKHDTEEVHVAADDQCLLDEIVDRPIGVAHAFAPEAGTRRDQTDDRPLRSTTMARRSSTSSQLTDANEIRRKAHNRNRGGQRMRRGSNGEVPRHQHVDPERKKLRNELPRSRRVSLRVALLQDKVAAEDVSAFLKPPAQARDAHVRVRKPGPVIANARNFPPRARRRRPRAAVGNVAGLSTRWCRRSSPIRA